MSFSICIYAKSDAEPIKLFFPTRETMDAYVHDESQACRAVHEDYWKSIGSNRPKANHALQIARMEYAKKRGFAPVRKGSLRWEIATPEEAELA